MTKRTGWVLLAAGVAALTVVAGCGGSSGKPTAARVGSSPTSTPAASATSSDTTAKKPGKGKPASTPTTAKGATGSTSATTVAGRHGFVAISGLTDTLPTITVPLVTPAAGPAPTTGTTTHTTPTTVKPYDPAQGIDLSGTPGETHAGQVAAEQLVRASLKDLPRYSTEAAAYAAGFRSIGDGLTGDEHYINWSYLNDSHVLDPMYPESLVYDVRGPTPKLEAAMFMLSLGQHYSDIPPLFTGPLTQWHIHNNLCFRDLGGNPDQQVVAGLTDGDGNCSTGLEKSVPVPMIHVWIVKNPCGPFAALEGIGAGQTASGQRNCDELHAGTL